MLDMLQEMVSTKQKVRIYTTNGFQMSGTVLCCDDSCLLFKHDGKRSIVMLHAISTISVEDKK